MLMLKHFAPWGTVENLALGSSQLRDLPAVGCIHIPEGEVCTGDVFITFGGPQGHADRLANLRPIGKSARREEPPVL